MLVSRSSSRRGCPRAPRSPQALYTTRGPDPHDTRSTRGGTEGCAAVDDPALERAD